MFLHGSPPKQLYAPIRKDIIELIVEPDEN